jgi:hypothetical protein
VQRHLVVDQFREIGGARHQVKTPEIVHQTGKHRLIAIDLGHLAGQHTAKRRDVRGVIPQTLGNRFKRLHRFDFSNCSIATANDTVRTASMPTRTMALLTSATSRPEGFSATEFAMRMILVLINGSAPTSLASFSTLRFSSFRAVRTWKVISRKVGKVISIARQILGDIFENLESGGLDSVVSLAGYESNAARKGRRKAVRLERDVVAEIIKRRLRLVLGRCRGVIGRLIVVSHHRRMRPARPCPDGNRAFSFRSPLISVV